MKTSSLLAFSFFFLALLAFTRAEFIIDDDGYRLNNGGTYYIRPQHSVWPVIRVATVSEGGSSASCSLAVVHAVQFFSNGLPIKLTSTYSTKYITDDYPLNITFATLPSNACTNTPTWVVTKIHGFEGLPVMVGNFEEFSYPISGYFYIKPVIKFSIEYYKLVFCKDKANCGDVILEADSQRNQRLAVSSDRTKQPLLLYFAKASGESVVESGISMVV